MTADYRRGMPDSQRVRCGEDEVFSSGNSELKSLSSCLRVFVVLEPALDGRRANRHPLSTIR